MDNHPIQFHTRTDLESASPELREAFHAMIEAAHAAMLNGELGYPAITATAHILSYSWLCDHCERTNPEYEPQSETPLPLDTVTCDDCGRVYAVGHVEIEHERC